MNTVVLLLAMNMAATLFRLTPEEALAGATRNAARALGLLPETGTLEAGKWCDLAIWDERSTLHRAVGDHFPARRAIHRCVVEGDRPQFAA